MNILILDDEMLARQELTFLIQQSKELDHPDIFEAEDISSAEKILFRQQIDLIFLIFHSARKMVLPWPIN